MPIRRVENSAFRGDQLLESPPSRKPPAMADFGGLVGIGRHGNVLQVHIADLGISVPVIHGIDSLGELGTAFFIDAASAIVNLSPIFSPHTCRRAATYVSTQT